MSEDRSSSSSDHQKSWFERLAQAFNDEPRSRKDIINLLDTAVKSEVIDQDAFSIAEGALEVSEVQARDIMIPPSQMIVIKSEDDPKTSIRKVIDSSHSRFPVVGEDSDEILGVLLAKDLLPLLFKAGEIDQDDLLARLRPANFIPESKRLNVLLNEFRTKRYHMAIVLDEYGSVSGLVTIEDVLEQIVGEIEDETDKLDSEAIQPTDNNKVFLVPALCSIEEFNEFFKTELSEEEFDTIGGIIVQQFGHVPNRGEEIEFNGFHFSIIKSDGRRVKTIQVTQSTQEDVI
ncbi:HlyC/CorC family transporter [Marinomonas mediterranea]|jgi:Putative Mg2+ and Co2+ transporter CorC|uniref:Magnesium and cobalt efflux protein CorC n=1 Tax=Marinomonas mediterranea (strain ATCC 700492 / JCM 21426 / NBRC 103028 / MMB-1) TaxID=717774 RepID=F2K1M0_MARM1|nr:transporter associated domain-containing protein [Marinomonas mediterranea]ADZ92250.1 transporter-associated region [Marinomonas mediterranea MMB-1]WCN10207.1 CBS domain-containing protein [Marinomonas mediterranea]WCN14251.1 CBS domain-containing protein [Marinomonas mediterranea]WCN18308.1 CBS domain-containing protein [Marinomonas mediterranea MMB-1]